MSSVVAPETVIARTILRLIGVLMVYVVAWHYFGVWGVLGVCGYIFGFENPLFRKNNL